MSVLPSTATPTRRWDTHHLQKLVALIQVGHDNALSFRNSAINTNELAIPSHGIYLVKR